MHLIIDLGIAVESWEKQKAIYFHFCIYTGQKYKQ